MRTITTASIFRWAVITMLSTVATAQFRSIDGSGNNPLHPEMGAANTPLVRLMAIAYEDGLSTPRMSGMPGARQISNLISAQITSIRNDERASDMTWQWGQFLDHDIDLTESARPSERLDIPVPLGDPMFDPFHSGTQVIPLSRSKYSIDSAGVRQQMNGITAWIDGSNIYGSDQARANALRTLDGTGRLRVSAGDLLPFNTEGLPNAGGPNPNLFLAGDVRANEQSGLVAMHTLFVREHNFWANQLAIFGLSGNDTYQLARWVVAAEIQAITYEEFLPVILDDDTLSDYQGYDPTVDAGISNVFSTAGYRFGHSMLSSELLRLNADMEEIPAGHLPLLGAFFNPSAITVHGIEPYLRGLAFQTCQAVDTMIVDDVRNFLFGPPGSGGFDLAALNIQRGRDHGLPCYNVIRAGCGLAPKSRFIDINPDPQLASALASTYASVEDIDPWVGILAEPPVDDALVGETAQAIMKHQFECLRDGDLFFYKNTMPPSLQEFIEDQTLGIIIRRNTTIGNEIDEDVFRAEEDID